MNYHFNICVTSAVIWLFIWGWLSAMSNVMAVKAPGFMLFAFLALAFRKNHINAKAPDRLLPSENG